MSNEHNYYRPRHCVQSLQLDDDLNGSAQKYAQYLADNNLFEHSEISNVGENLWWAYNSRGMNNLNGSTPTDDWYDEIKLYNFNRPDSSEDTDHFTQLIWKSTTKLGAGVAFNRNRNEAYVVAHYKSPGNYINRFQENVLPRNC